MRMREVWRKFAHLPLGWSIVVNLRLPIKSLLPTIVYLVQFECLENDLSFRFNPITLFLIFYELNVYFVR